MKGLIKIGPGNENLNNFPGNSVLISTKLGSQGYSQNFANQARLSTAQQQQKQQHKLIRGVILAAVAKQSSQTAVKTLSLYQQRADQSDSFNLLQEMSSRCNYRPGLSMTMRTKIHTANKKLSMIRSRSMDRFSRRQEVISVTPRQRQAALEYGGSYCGPFIGQARAVVDFTPNPYDREALKLSKGDLIDIIDTNASGMWRGRCNGKVGNFKFLNVQPLPSRAERFENTDTKWRSVSSVQEFLTMLDLEEYISVFVLNGFESMEALESVNLAVLDYLGIKDVDHRNIILTALTTSLDNSDQFIRGPERDSGCFMSDRMTSHDQGSQEHPDQGSQGLVPSSSESGVSEEEFTDRRNCEEEVYPTSERFGRSGRSKSSRAIHVTNATIMIHGLTS